MTDDNKQFILNNDLSDLQDCKCVMDNYADVDTWYTLGATVDLLNEVSEENEQLKEENKELEEQVGNDYNEANSLTVKIANLEEELNYYKAKCGSCEEGLFQQDRKIAKLEKENKKLKEILKHTYEIHECETCKHNQYFNWLDPATMEREYDSKCGKGLHYDDEVHDCEEYELDLEMFKKRVKR